MTYEPPKQHPYDPLAAPPVFDSVPVYDQNGHSTQNQQYTHYDQQPSPQQQSPQQQQYSPAPMYAPPAYPQYPAQYPVAIPQNGVGTAAMILGILSLTLCGLFAAVPAIICGMIGMGKAKRGEANNHGTAMAGVIMGGVAILLTVGLIIFYVFLFAATASSGTTRY